MVVPVSLSKEESVPRGAVVLDQLPQPPQGIEQLGQVRLILLHFRRGTIQQLGLAPLGGNGRDRGIDEGGALRIQLEALVEQHADADAQQDDQPANDDAKDLPESPQGRHHHRATLTRER
jgi:hypothetical protein